MHPITTCILTKNKNALLQEIKKTNEINFQDEQGNSALHYACINSVPIEFIKILVENGSNEYTPLIYATGSNSSFEVIKYLVKNGANVNARNYKQNTALHYACWSKGKPVDLNSIELLIQYGADPYSVNIEGKKPENMLNSNLKNEEINKVNKLALDLLHQPMAIVDDFQKLFDRKELTDSEIQGIPVHSIWIQTRIGNSPTKIEKIIGELENSSLLDFLKWVYCGSVPTDSESIIELMEICEKLEINFQTKSGKVGILKDLNTLYKDHDSKDFTLIVEKQEIKIHKIILLARSELFRGMFSCLEKQIDQIKDQSNRPLKIINEVIKFLYTETIDQEKNLNNDELEDFYETTDYFLLNERSAIQSKIERIKVDRKKSSSWFGWGSKKKK
ncbi:ankyrin repeat-containing protein [Anaeramoeba flamelloides]|uniref:Ankyrin repeat-containing protein n=1 Tax=Anaeramoeba flamelloides TaxID=1746091 RepID=A0AAV7ZP84_9EUKA|nr:ankyrin repeat-containing protein [Anaeramoeba flamelloides]